MRRNYFLPAMVSFFILVSCNKDAANPNSEILGKWIWRISSSTTGESTYPNDPSDKSYFIEFNKGNTFTKTLSFAKVGPTDGNYEIKYLDDFKVLILTSQDYLPDTLRLSVTADSLVLTQTPNGYYSTTGGSWYHHFYKDAQSH